MSKRIRLVLCCICILGASCSPETLPEEGPAEAFEEPAVPDPSASYPSGLSAEESLVQWVSSMQSGNGLVESATGTDFVSLYDNALAALLFMESGKQERARQLLDYFDQAQQDEFERSGGGFYQFRDLNGLQRSRVWLGDNLWLLLAMKHYQKTYSVDRYQKTILETEAWVRSLQDTDGGLWGGLEDSGQQIPKVTEGILTAYAAVSGYDEFHQGIATFLSEKRWDPENGVLLAEDQPGPYAHALDLHSLSALYWPDQANPVLTSSDRFFNTRNHSLYEIPISGYCFDEDRDVVWLEGSAQMALAFKVTGNMDPYENTLTNLEESMIQCAANPALYALPYAANHGSSYGAVPLWDHADDIPAVSASVWFYFALHGFNPMRISGAAHAPINQ